MKNLKELSQALQKNQRDRTPLRSIAPLPHNHPFKAQLIEHSNIDSKNQRFNRKNSEGNSNNDSVLTYAYPKQTLEYDNRSRQNINQELTAQKLGHKAEAAHAQVTELKRQKENQSSFGNHQVQHHQKLGQDLYLSPIKSVFNHNLDNVGYVDLTELERESSEIEKRISQLRSQSEYEVIKRSARKSQESQGRQSEYEIMKQKYSGAVLNDYRR